MDIPYRYGTMSEVKQMIDTTEPLAWDTETKGKYGKVCLSQFYQRHWDAVILVKHPSCIELIEVLNSVQFAAHNAHYDITTVQEQTGFRWIPDNFICTFLAGRLHFFNEDSFSLDDIMSYVLGYDPYQKAGLNKSTLQKTDYDVPHLTIDQEVYAAIDVYYLLDVVDAVSDQFEEQSYILDMSALKYFLDIQWNGMPVDIERMSDIYCAEQEKADKLCGDINVNSYIQVRKALNINKSDEKALVKLISEGNELAKDILAKRKILKRISFMNKFSTEDGRIYGKFKVSARSGRTTSEDQNLQQIPRALKACFGLPVGGDRVIVYADYAQIELRTICAITVCRAMERLFRAGEDLHNYTRDFIFGTVEDEYKRILDERGIEFIDGELEKELWALAESIANDNRQVSKTCNFNFLYAGGVDVFLMILLTQTGIIMSDKKGYNVRKKWRKLWRELFIWQQKGIAAHQAGKAGSTALGRRYTAARVTDHLNIENQGSAAEVAKLACHYMRPRIAELNAELNTNTIVCDFIHDSWIIECDNKPEVYERVADILAKSMQEAWFEMSRLFNITDLPMPVNVRVGYNWGDIEKDIGVIYEYNLEGMTYATV